MASPTESDAEEAITKDEIVSSAGPETGNGTTTSQGTKRNAFTELMSPKIKVPAPPPPPPGSSSLTTMHRSFYSRASQSHSRRDGLGAYADAPEAYPPSRVIFHDADFVAIHDLYPKASVHALLIARSPTLRRLHPFDALGGATPESAALLAAARVQAQRLKRLVAAELRRRFGAYSALDARREAVLNGGGRGEGEGEGEGGGEDPQGGQEQGREENSAAKDTLPPTPTPTPTPTPNPSAPQLPPGRDWEAEVLVGVHAHPSMNDLHVHVVSRDMHSACLKHAKHYNSFATPFLVPLDDLPLAPGDPRLPRPGTKNENYLARDLRCWRCGEGFGRRFARLKEHLEVEFQEWKKE
ncbi:aprataxin-like protein [Diatrype stigma]|uniref:Aprataxin-like protein n=1 Tax=Diatrype stigma TaxID=117547 RepID=A0AAN9UBF6_9PEZI